MDCTIRHSINGRFLNGISQSSGKKGDLCRESEGAEMRFQTSAFLELPPGITKPEQIALVVGK